MRTPEIPKYVLDPKVTINAQIVLENYRATDFKSLLQNLMGSVQKKSFSFNPLYIYIPKLLGLQQILYDYTYGTLYFENVKLSADVERTNVQIFPDNIIYFSQITWAKQLGGLEITTSVGNNFVYINFLPPDPKYNDKLSVRIPPNIPFSTWNSLIKTCYESIVKPRKFTVRTISK